MTLVTPLGEDVNDPLTLLKDELARVSPSPGFAAGVRDRIALANADGITTLRAELAELTVSPEFAVRVRQRIEARRAWRFEWRWAVPAAGLAAATVAVLLWPRLLNEPPRSPVTTTIVRSVAPPVAPPAGTSSAPRVAPPVTAAGVRVSRVPRVPRVLPAHVPMAERDPMLDVITDQPALLRALRPSISRPGVTVDAAEQVAMYQAPRIEVSPIEVGPIPAYVVPDARLPIGVRPIILRIAADSAERSFR